MTYTTRLRLSKTAPVSNPIPADARFAVLDRFAGETYVARFFDADETSIARSFADGANLDLVEIVDFTIWTAVSDRETPTITYTVDSFLGKFEVVYDVAEDETVALPTAESFDSSDEVLELLAEAFDAGADGIASCRW